MDGKKVKTSGSAFTLEDLENFKKMIEEIPVKPNDKIYVNRKDYDYLKEMSNFYKRKREKKNKKEK